MHVKEKESDPDPAADSTGWIAVLSNGAFYISATEEQIDEITAAGGIAGSSGDAAKTFVGG